MAPWGRHYSQRLSQLQREDAIRRRIPVNKRVRDLLLEISIGITIVVAIAVYAIYVPPVYRFSARWAALAMFTPIIFGYPLRWHRQHWRVGTFWLMFSALLVIHLASLIVVLRMMEHFGWLWFAILVPLEWSIINSILRW